MKVNVAKVTFEPENLERLTWVESLILATDYPVTEKNVWDFLPGDMPQNGTTEVSGKVIIDIQGVVELESEDEIPMSYYKLVGKVEEDVIVLDCTGMVPRDQIHNTEDRVHTSENQVHNSKSFLSKLKDTFITVANMNIDSTAKRKLVKLIWKRNK